MSQKPLYQVPVWRETTATPTNTESLRVGEEGCGPFLGGVTQPTNAGTRIQNHTSPPATPRL